MCALMSHTQPTGSRALAQHSQRQPSAATGDGAQLSDSLFGSAPAGGPPPPPYASVVDERSFIDYFLLTELTKNVDAYACVRPPRACRPIPLKWPTCRPIPLEWPAPVDPGFAPVLRFAAPCFA